jgi:hypothetical protein
MKYHKIGGVRFLRVGRITITFCLRRKVKT